MGRYGKLNYPKLTKRGFFLGVALFVLGGAGELIGHSLTNSLPGWEDMLFVDMIVLGIVIGFFSVILFGIVLPLTE